MMCMFLSMYVGVDDMFLDTRFHVWGYSPSDLATPNINATPNREIIQFLISSQRLYLTIQVQLENPHPKIPKKPVGRRRNTRGSILQTILHGIMFSACALLDRKRQLKLTQYYTPLFFMRQHSHPRFIRISTREKILISWPPSRIYLFAL